MILLDGALCFTPPAPLLAVPDSILKKKGPLDDAELETMREHAAAGARIVG